MVMVVWVCVKPQEQEQEQEQEQRVDTVELPLVPPLPSHLTTSHPPHHLTHAHTSVVCGIRCHM